MPIFEYECLACGEIFEFLKIKSDEWCTECPICHSQSFERTISMPHIRTNSDSIMKSLPDPVPPLTELIDKQRPGTEGGFQELKNEQRQLKEYDRTKDKFGNSVWMPKEKIYIDGGKSK